MHRPEHGWVCWGVQHAGSGAHARVAAPVQVEVPEGMSLAGAQALLAAAGLEPPLLVKPLWTDGREGSHGLAVLHDMAALGRLLHGEVSLELKPPLVVQQFVDHGGLLYKVRRAAAAQHAGIGARCAYLRRPLLAPTV